MGPNPWSALLIFLVVGLQFVLAYLLKDSSFWLILLVSYLVGAFANHSLFVMIHECGHNLVLKGATRNRIMGIICNFPIVFPAAIGFRNYHFLHHSHLAEYGYDADLAGPKEAQWVGNSPIRKMLWLLFFFFVEGFLRPARLKKVKLWEPWVVANLVVQVIVDVAVVYFLGWGALLYLALSAIFSVGLHPLGARWIQEHYLTNAPQETYGYYGIANKVAFNIGYHNEHHDLMTIPWNRLPKLKKMAPEFYDHLAHYKSYTALLFRFIFDRNLTLYSRIVHPDNDKGVIRPSKDTVVAPDEKAVVAS